MILPEFQGRGIAGMATAQAIELAKRDDKHRIRRHRTPPFDPPFRREGLAVLAIQRRRPAVLAPQPPYPLVSA
jgi:hypothetical protein